MVASHHTKSTSHTGKRFQRYLHLIAPVLSLLLVAGCATVGPDYTPPQMEMRSDWHTQADPALLTRADLVRQWWSLFEAPLLNHLIDTAARNNLDLLTAIARVEETHARLGVVRGERWPSAEADGNVIRQRSSENAFGNGEVDTLYGGHLGASWEIDLIRLLPASGRAAGSSANAASPSGKGG